MSNDNNHLRQETSRTNAKCNNDHSSHITSRHSMINSSLHSNLSTLMFRPNFLTSQNPNASVSVSASVSADPTSASFADSRTALDLTLGS